MSWRFRVPTQHSGAYRHYLPLQTIGTGEGLQSSG